MRVVGLIEGKGSRKRSDALQSASYDFFLLWFGSARTPGPWPRPVGLGTNLRVWSVFLPPLAQPSVHRVHPAFGLVWALVWRWQW